MAKRKRRTFTPEFKTEVVLEALQGESSQAELPPSDPSSICRHNVPPREECQIVEALRTQHSLAGARFPEQI